MAIGQAQLQRRTAASSEITKTLRHPLARGPGSRIRVRATGWLRHDYEGPLTRAFCDRHSSDPALGEAVSGARLGFECSGPWRIGDSARLSAWCAKYSAYQHAKHRIEGATTEKIRGSHDQKKGSLHESTGKQLTMSSCGRFGLYTSTSQLSGQAGCQDLHLRFMKKGAEASMRARPTTFVSRSTATSTTCCLPPSLGDRKSSVKGTALRLPPGTRLKAQDRGDHELPGRQFELPSEQHVSSRITVAGGYADWRMSAYPRRGRPQWRRA